MSEGSWKVVEVMPTLAVTDLDAALAYYRDLGFLEQWTYPSGDAPTHVGMSFGPVNLMLADHADGATIERQNLYFVVEGIAEYRRDVQSRLGEDLPELVDADYDMRDFSIEDPWGHLLTFGEGS